MDNIFENELKIYKPAIMLDRIFPRMIRRFLKAILFVSTIALLTLLIFYVVQTSLEAEKFSLNVLFGEATMFFGIFLLSLCSLLFVLSLSFFFNARFFRGIELITHEIGGRDEHGISYESAEIMLKAKPDLVRAFIDSKYGKEILLRCNIQEDNISNF